MSESLSSQRRFSPESSGLISGIPDSVVTDSLLPRLPWYIRPRLRTLSKTWLHALRDPTCYSGLTRAAMRGRDGGLIVAHQLSKSASEADLKEVKMQRRTPQPHCLSIYDHRCERWNALPPIPGLGGLRILHECGLVCVDRKVFVMGGWDPTTDAVTAHVHMLNLGSGLWQWQKRRSMRSAKSQFYSTCVAGKIYVVGGASSQNLTNEEPLPEVYDVQRDEWEDLPQVTLSRSFNYTGLGVTGSQVLAFGFRSLEKGQLANFWRQFDPESKIWQDWDCHLDKCTDLLAGEYDLRDGVVHILDKCSKEWTPLDGKLSATIWRWNAGKRVMSDSTCAHNFLVVKDSNKVHVYATICGGEIGSFSLWRGDINFSHPRVSWAEIELPGNLSTCSEMAFLQD